MTITWEQIDLWRGAASETQNLEFKEAKNQYDTNKLCRYCVAIANEGGGHLEDIRDRYSFPHPLRPERNPRQSWFALCSLVVSHTFTHVNVRNSIGS